MTGALTAVDMDERGDDGDGDLEMQNRVETEGGEIVGDRPRKQLIMLASRRGLKWTLILGPGVKLENGRSV